MNGLTSTGAPMRYGTAFRKFKINWRIKVLAFWIFNTLPFGSSLYYFFQKNVTKTCPRPLAPTQKTAKAFLDNFAAMQVHFGPQRMPDISVLEFGAGWDLYGNIVLWCLGVNHQFVCDLTPWAKPTEINHVIRHLQADPPPGAVRLPQTLLNTAGEDGWQKDLKDLYGIHYCAPFDIIEAPLPDETVDAIITTSTFEHIPAGALRQILNKCFKLLKPDGVMSHCIDYGDHYAHSDSSIGPYNFLHYSSQTWRWFNPGIHFQNRLRHADHRDLLLGAGFKVAHEIAETPEGYDAYLAAVALAEEFAARPRQELLPVYGQFVVTKS